VVYNEIYFVNHNLVLLVGWVVVGGGEICSDEATDSIKIIIPSVLLDIKSQNSYALRLVFQSSMFDIIDGPVHFDQSLTLVAVIFFARIKIIIQLHCTYLANP